MNPNIPKKRKGKLKTRTRILNYLHSIDQPQTGHDIAFNLNLSKRKIISQLNILVRQNSVSVKRPLRHLGENFPSIYWYKGE